jgi:hypothetical protein
MGTKVEIIIAIAKLLESSSLRNVIKPFTDELFDNSFKGDMRNECYYCEFRKKLPGSAHSMCEFPDREMTGDEYGIESGWFMYPINYDPVWKKRDCEHFVQNREYETT